MSADKEGRVERYLVQRVAGIGGRALKFVSPGQAGVPDRVCFVPGLATIFVECKAPGERLRPLQRAVHEEMAAHGATVYTVSSEADVEDLIRTWRTWWIL